MKISVVSFTRAGAVKNLELVSILQQNNHQAVSYSWHKYTGRRLIPFKSLKLLLQDLWENQDAFLFLWDLEHVAKAVTPYLKQNGQGPAVVVMDEDARFVIPFSAGRMPGTNEWCGRFARLVDATAIITASFREEERFRPDAFAGKNQLHIQDIFRIRTIESKLAAGESVGIYSDYPVEGVLPEGLLPVGEVMNCGGKNETALPEAGISITDDWDAPHFAKECRMFPRSLVLGVVCDADSGAAALERFVVGALVQNRLSRQRLCGLFSVRELAECAGLKLLADKLDVPFFTYERGQLPGDLKKPEEICAACARMGSQNGRKLADCVQKDGMLAAVYEKEVELSF